jgi:predicted DNA-binding protein (MmcQ/YjbR family)
VGYDDDARRRREPAELDGAMAAARSRPIRQRDASSERRVERLRRICASLPEAREKLSHGEPTWFAGAGRVFAMLDDHHHGEPHLAVWLPQPPGAQPALIRSDPERFFRPPYVGPKGWIGVVLDGAVDWKLVAGLVREAYLHVATPRLAAQLGAPRS